MELRERLQILEQEYAHYQEIFAQASAAATEANKNADAQAEARERGTARAYAELIATRTAPLQRVRADLAQVEQTNPLPAGVSWEQIALTKEEFAALEQAVFSYQKNYQETYELCQKLESSATCGLGQGEQAADDSD